MRMTAAIGALVLLVLVAPHTARVSAQGPAPRWIATWYAAPTARGEAGPPAALAPGAREWPVPPAVLAVAPGQPLQVGGQSMLHVRQQTLRQIAHVSLGGPQVRVVLTNLFGTSPLPVDEARVALRVKDATIDSTTSTILRFGGHTRVVIPAGATVTSDAVDLRVPDLADLAIDLFLPGDTAATKSPLTIHPASWQTNYLSTFGNHAGVLSLPVAATTAYRRTDGLVSASSFFLARVEVPAALDTRVVVTLGDSITDGTHSGMDANSRWPDHLARRLLQAGMRLGVANAGIGGNRVLADGNGPSALSRFDRDVLDQPGVAHVIVLEGINDIGQARENASPDAAAIIAAHRQMIDRAHARGLKIYGATLTPFEGANYFTPQGEAKRQALNDWIRTSKAYDAVLDFDAVIRDPAHPSRMQEQFDPGDHLHLNAAGYKAVADSIDPALFRR